MTNQRYEIELDWNTILAVGLVVTGVVFILSQVFGLGIGAATIAFFLFLVLPGMPFLYFAVTGGKDLSWLAIPGSLISGTGTILMLQSITGHWESWAYMWMLYGVLIGVPLLYAGTRNEEKAVQAVGKIMSIFSGVGFLSLFLFFELIIFNGSGGRLLLALLLIGGGLWMIMRDDDFEFSTRFGSAEKPKNKNSLDDYVQSPPIETAESYVQAAKSRLKEKLNQADAELADDRVPYVEPTPNGQMPVQE